MVNITTFSAKSDKKGKFSTRYAVAANCTPKETALAGLACQASARRHNNTIALYMPEQRSTYPTGGAVGREGHVAGRGSTHEAHPVLRRKRGNGALPPLRVHGRDCLRRLGPAIGKVGATRVRNRTIWPQYRHISRSYFDITPFSKVILSHHKSYRNLDSGSL